MGANSKMEWTDHTFNPWIGCTKVATGCQHCYAESFAKHYGKAVWGQNGSRVKTSEAYWRKPLKWNREAEKAGVRARVFCASLADVFEEWGGPIQGSGKDDDILADDVRRDLFRLIDATPWLDWLLLTKRPENIRSMWHNFTLIDDPDGGKIETRFRNNVWLGTSVACQADADRNIPELLKCRDLSPVLFVSAEPLVGPVALTNVGEVDGRPLCCLSNHPCVDSDPGYGIDWVICGGESGHGARPMHPDWARGLRDQCQAAGVPFFFKQWGEWASPEQLDEDGFMAWEHHATSMQDEKTPLWFGKRFCGRLLDGREWNDFPDMKATT